jgi:hypothetical protein
LEPNDAVPVPDKVMIDAPVVFWEMSNVPVSMTSEEVAIEPVLDSAKVAPLPMLVAPV